MNFIDRVQRVIASSSPFPVKGLTPVFYINLDEVTSNRNVMHVSYAVKIVLGDVSKLPEFDLSKDTDEDKNHEDMEYLADFYKDVIDGFDLEKDLGDHLVASLRNSDSNMHMIKSGVIQPDHYSLEDVQVDISTTNPQASLKNLTVTCKVLVEYEIQTGGIESYLETSLRRYFSYQD